jgi:hypothetical protein
MFFASGEPIAGHNSVSVVELGIQEATCEGDSTGCIAPGYDGRSVIQGQEGLHLTNRKRIRERRWVEIVATEDPADGLQVSVLLTADADGIDCYARGTHLVGKVLTGISAWLCVVSIADDDDTSLRIWILLGVLQDLVQAECKGVE